MSSTLLNTRYATQIWVLRSESPYILYTDCPLPKAEGLVSTFGNKIHKPFLPSGFFTPLYPTICSNMFQIVQDFLLQTGTRSKIL